MNPDEKQLAVRRIVELMRQRGWDNTDMVRATGLSKNTIGDALNEKREPHENTIRAMLDALDVPPEPMGLLKVPPNVPEDVRIFLTIAARRLPLLSDDERAAAVDALFSRLFELVPDPK